MEKLVELGSSIKVCFIVGNHDFHLRNLEDHRYPFQFLESMAPMQAGSTSYNFKHGWEFDLEQQPPIMEALCHNLSNGAGADRTEVYNAFTGLEDKLENVFKLHGGMDGYLDHLLQGPESRLEEVLPTIEKAAYASLGPGERLVFGHTHRPFVSVDGRLANAGSWVTDAAVHNTFVELDGDQIRLFVFDVAGITEITERMPLTQLT